MTKMSDIECNFVDADKDEENETRLEVTEVDVIVQDPDRSPYQGRRTYYLVVHSSIKHQSP